jgi:hypothetical protein
VESGERPPLRGGKRRKMSGMPRKNSTGEVEYGETLKTQQKKGKWQGNASE